jgi:hypothetical protein
MPSVRDHLDEDYVFVQAHVRKRKNRRKPIDPLAFIIFFVLAAVFIYWVLKTYWIWITVGLVILLTIYVLTHWKKWKLKILKSKVGKIEAKAELDETISDYENRLRTYKKR